MDHEIEILTETQMESVDQFALKNNIDRKARPPRVGIKRTSRERLKSALY